VTILDAKDDFHILGLKGCASGQDQLRKVGKENAIVIDP